MVIAVVVMCLHCLLCSLILRDGLWCVSNITDWSYANITMWKSAASLFSASFQSEMV